MAVIAIVRGVPSSFARALVAVAPDEPIDVERARSQHRAYLAGLRQAGAEVVEIPADESHPDCCFVEDTAVVAGGIALLTRPGAPSRRGEPAGVRAALSRWLAVVDMEAPATLDGGDCLRLGDRLYIGRSVRTNAAGIGQAREIFGRVGIEVIEVPVRGALHLKSVCSPLADRIVLVAPGTLPADTFPPGVAVEVPAAEAVGANLVEVGGSALVAAGCPVVASLVAGGGLVPIPVDTSELRKADGALTCLSIVIDRPAGGAPA